MTSITNPKNTLKYTRKTIDTSFWRAERAFRGFKLSGVA